VPPNQGIANLEKTKYTNTFGIIRNPEQHELARGETFFSPNQQHTLLGTSIKIPPTTVRKEEGRRFFLKILAHIASEDSPTLPKNGPSNMA